MTGELQPHEVIEGELVEYSALIDFTEQWLANRRFSENTRLGYRRDVHQWLAWCETAGLNPLQVGWVHVNAWGRALEMPDQGRPAAATTVARKMSAVSSWFSFLVKLGRLEANPAAAADRPLVDRDFSSTAAFTHEDAMAMLRVAGADPWLGPAAKLLATWLVELGTRATETIGVQMEQLGHDRGFQVVRMIGMKGGRSRVRVIPPSMCPLLDEYLAWRAACDGVSIEEMTGPLFVNADGAILTRFDVYRFVRRLAKTAGLPNAGQVTPHSFRHAWNRIARRNGAQLEDRQHAMGHKDPRTTRRYDSADVALERDPSLLVAAAVAEPLDHA
jgi:site-specific recombinase XerD